MRVVVTGAASGIGRATAEAFRANGDDVVLIDVSSEPLTDVVEALGDRAWPVVADLGDPEQAEGAIAEAERRLGGIDVLVNNAGVAAEQPFLDVTEEDWQTLVRVNVLGAWVVARRAARTMVTDRSGCIVNTSSISGTGGRPPQSVYGITKGALLGLTLQLAGELAPFGVRVNAVLPGVIDTPMVRRTLEVGGDPDGVELDRWIRAEVPLGRIGRAAEVADVIRFLASSVITGALLPVEGGFLSA